MYELLYFNDFPKCKNHKILVKDSNKNSLDVWFASSLKEISID